MEQDFRFDVVGRTGQHSCYRQFDATFAQMTRLQRGGIVLLDVED